MCVCVCTEHGWVAHAQLNSLKPCRFIWSSSICASTIVANMQQHSRSNGSHYRDIHTLFSFIVCCSLLTGPLPKGHNQHEPYTPHDIEFSAALPYKVEMMDGEGCFFLLEGSLEQPDADITKVQFSKNDFVHDFNKLIAIETSGPV